MASSLALKRLVYSNLLPRSLRSVRPAASVPDSRLLNTNAARQYEDVDDHGIVDRSSEPTFYSLCDLPSYSDVFYPASSRNLSQILNMKDFLSDSPVASAIRRRWDAKEKEDGLYLKLDMPGLGKEDVKVSVEQNTLIIKGEGQMEYEDEESGRRVSSRIDLPDNLYKINEIKAEMKNGVLKLFVPKLKEEERTDVLQVKVD